MQLHHDTNAFFLIGLDMCSIIGEFIGCRKDKAAFAMTSATNYAICESAPHLDTRRWVLLRARWDEDDDAKFNPHHIYRDAQMMWMVAHIRLWLAHSVLGRAQMLGHDVADDKLEFSQLFEQDIEEASLVAMRSGFLKSQKYWPPMFGREKYTRRVMGFFLS